MISFFKSQKFRAGLPTVLFITVLWLLIGMAEVGWDYLVFFQYNLFPEEYDVWATLKSHVAAIGVAAFFAGCLLVYWVNDHLKNYHYGRVLWMIFGYYNVIFLCAIIVRTVSYHFEMDTQTNVFTTIIKNIVELKFIRAYFFWAIVSLLTMIAIQVNDKYGTGVFWAFLRGDYFHPKREERIFMFLDLRGSTTIAEKIGERLFFEFIRDFYKDVTPGILANKGEIYQYVGDEVVVSWTKENGLSNKQALKCFFDIETAIAKKADNYRAKYEIVPSFKAGLHIGTAMIGEIGVIKKDIAFSGDVLNTTSRIQAHCNDFKVNLLISQELVDALNLSESKFHTQTIGNVQLRGREKTVILHTIASPLSQIS